MNGDRQRILLSSHGASPFGAERVLLILAEGLARRGHAVTLEIPHEGPALEVARSLVGVEVWLSERPRLPRNLREAAMYAAGIVPAMAKLRRHIRMARYDVVWVNSMFNPVAAIAARLAGAPVVWHLHERNFRGLAAAPMAWLVRASSNVTVPVSEFVAGSFARVPGGGARQEVLFAQAPALPELPEAESTGCFVVGFVGQFERRKRIPDVLRAIAQVPDTCGLLVGDGKRRVDVEHLVARYHLRGRVELAGFQHDVVPFYRRMDCVVTPSRDEACPLVAFEAMATGRPVIAADHGGYPEVLGDAALYFPLGDVSALADRIMRLEQSPTLRECLRRRGLARAERFGREQWLDRVEQITNSVTRVRRERVGLAPMSAQALDAQAETRRRNLPSRILALAAAAIALRLVLLLGRGDYLAFDEGWYLLLGRSLFTGDGYSLIGIPHVTLSPLFPILAGVVGALIDDWVWGGRIVAAVTSGLLVLPAWSVFRRLASERVAFVACALIAVLPSMAPFVVPYWIGADLWVGAEPVLHLLLYTGIALWLRADADGEAAEPGRLTMWFIAGAVFALAFLARPEAIITWGFLGLAALAIAARWRSPRRLVGAVLMGTGFLVVASPYWLYVHDVTGGWNIAGRGVAPVAAVTAALGSSSGSRRPAATIERMLWQDDEAYERFLYGLDETGLRLRSGYWGVRREEATVTSSPAARAGTSARTNGGNAAEAATGAGSGTSHDATELDVSAAEQTTARARPDPPSGVALYIHSLGIILPLLLWPFVILGMARPRSRRVLRRELPVSVALIGTSVAIGVVVAVDPRTQLFLVPLLAFYAACGFAVVGDAVRQRAARTNLRPGFVEILLAAIAVVWLLGIDVTRLYLSVAHGSPHHIVAEQNRAVAEELDELLAGDVGPVASWHPAIAVYADRDWRVLPFTDLSGIIRYEQAAGARAVVLSAYYPPPLGVENLDTRYLVLDMPRLAEPLDGWTLRLQPGDSIVRVGEVEASP